MKRIAVVTGSRAEYGLLRPLLLALNEDDEFDLCLIVTGSHLSKSHGWTVADIERDRLPIAARIDILQDSDSYLDMPIAVGKAVQEFSKTLYNERPALLIALGDRFESFAAVQAAYMCGIRVAHIHGGETTEGSMDEGFRHAMTKLSLWHFVSAETYRKRVIQLGEQPNRVFNVGAIGLDSVKHLKPFTRNELEKALDIDLPLYVPLIMMTYHPLTLDSERGVLECQSCLEAISELGEYRLILTYPNADNGWEQILSCLDSYAKNNSDQCRLIPSLGTQLYLSVVANADFVIGNSSSALIEVPSFHIPSIDVGDRQKGRIVGETVLQCRGEKSSLKRSIERALSVEFRERCLMSKNPYGDGQTTERIMEQLRREDFYTVSLIKTFFDISEVQWDCKKF